MEARKEKTFIVSSVNALMGVIRGAIGRKAPAKNREIRYWKPCMTNLPHDLGKEIFEAIRSAPAPDHKKMQEESERLIKEMLKERELENV